MVIVVLAHDGGWQDHVVVDDEIITVGRARDNDVVIRSAGVRDHHATLVAREAVGSVRIGEFTLGFEHHDDPIELRLLAASLQGDEQARAVYADWLDEHGRTTHAGFLRAQVEILAHDPDEPRFAELADRLCELEAVLPYGWRSHLERPVIQLGEPADFALRIGLARPTSPTQRMVQIWAAGIALTCDNDKVQPDWFAAALQPTAQQIARRDPLPFPELDLVATHQRLDDGHELRDHCRWLKLGPTTDNVHAFLFHEAGDALVSFAFWRPELCLDDTWISIDAH